MPDPFAYATDLEDRWKPLSPARSQLADNLLAAASREIRARRRSIDDDIEAGLDPELVTDVACWVVKRAMLNGEGQTSDTPYGLAVGDLEVTDDDLRILDDARSSVRKSSAALPRFYFGPCSA